MVEGQSVLAAGSVLAPGRLVPRGQLWAGAPARFVRDLTTDEVPFACMGLDARMEGERTCRKGFACGTWTGAARGKMPRAGSVCSTA